MNGDFLIIRYALFCTGNNSWNKRFDSLKLYYHFSGRVLLERLTEEILWYAISNCSVRVTKALIMFFILVFQMSSSIDI